MATMKWCNALAALGTAAALTMAAPALADDDDKSGMMHGGSGMMKDGGGMGMMSGGGMKSGGGMMSGHMMMKAMHMLELDEQQVQKMTDLHKGLAEKMAGTHVEMQQLRWQMAKEMKKDETSPEKVGEIFDQIAAKKKSMLQEKVRTHNEMMGMLSDEQREKMKEMKKRMHKKGKGGYKHKERDDD